MNFATQFIIFHISHIHHIMEYLAELFFVHSDSSLTQLVSHLAEYVRSGRYQLHFWHNIYQFF